VLQIKVTFGFLSNFAKRIGMLPETMINVVDDEVPSQIT
jgi:hypothetical protein